MSGEREGGGGSRVQAGGGEPGLRLGVLASGAGTNLQAILDTVHGRQGIEVVGVASDRPDAPALERARAAKVEVAVFPRDAQPDREARDAALADWLQERRVGLVVLAGYMQLLTPAFLARFPQRVINVHPALLPAFPGLDAIGQALAHGVKVFGVTVHFVDEGVDSGPIILQRALELPEARTVEEVHARLQEIEHDLLPEAIRLIARDAVAFDPDNPRHVIIR
jgi:phosphoribosylglycinamide formyltransferase 1